MPRLPTDRPRTGARADDALLERARAYPYPAPEHSYLLRDGAPEPFTPDAIDGRTPVLAIGSNRSPRRLREKFGDRAFVPVEHVTIEGFDIVYSAHVAGYGAVPAMLAAAPGVQASIAVTWLDDAQLEVMHESEIRAANYGYAELPGAVVRRADGERLAPVHAYLSTRGYLRDDDGGPIGLEAIISSGRTWRAIGCAGALEHVRERCAPEMGPDEFVLALVRDAGWRREVIERLAADAGPFGAPYRMI